MIGWFGRLLDVEDRSVSAPVCGGMALVLSFIIFTGYSLWESPDHHFNAQDFGVGASAIVVALGTAGWFKPKGMPPEIPPPSPGAQ